MIERDPVSGGLYDCDASGPCEECGSSGPLYLDGEIYDDGEFGPGEMLCWRCRLGREHPAFTRARDDGGKRGLVVAGHLVIVTAAWSGEITNGGARA